MKPILVGLVWVATLGGAYLLGGASTETPPVTEVPWASDATQAAAPHPPPAHRPARQAPARSPQHAGAAPSPTADPARATPASPQRESDPLVSPPDDEATPHTPTSATVALARTPVSELTPAWREALGAFSKTVSECGLTPTRSVAESLAQLAWDPALAAGFHAALQDVPVELLDGVDLGQILLDRIAKGSRHAPLWCASSFSRLPPLPLTEAERVALDAAFLDVVARSEDFPSLHARYVTPVRPGGWPAEKPLIEAALQRGGRAAAFGAWYLVQVSMKGKARPSEAYLGWVLDTFEIPEPERGLLAARAGRNAPR